MSFKEKLHYFSSCVEIAHHIPGRIRLRLILDNLSLSDESVQALIMRFQNFKEVLNNIPGVHSIRINAIARSCTIEYDHKIIPFQAWVDFFNDIDSEAGSVLNKIFKNKYEEIICT